jgi:aromatic ring-opening dioxygenase catalytic subunit (LigB family)
MVTEPKMPTWFIPHGGGPCFFMDWNPPDEWDRMAAFLRGIHAELPAVPKAILVVSAHWIEPDFAVSSGPAPELIYDYYGFPEHTYRLKYPAPGSPELASRVSELLGQQSIQNHADPHRGFDHGMFIPLMLMFPQANIPVVQLSLIDSLSPEAHLEAGRALAPLRDEGVLIVGSGMSFHNMRGYRDPRFAPISDEFDDWLKGAVSASPQARWQALAQWGTAPSARLCHPPRAEEHLLPLMVAAGAGTNDPGQTVFSDRVMQTTVSGYRFG